MATHPLTLRWLSPIFDSGVEPNWMGDTTRSHRLLGDIAPRPLSHVVSFLSRTTQSALTLDTKFRADEIPFESRLSPFGRELLAIRNRAIREGLVLWDAEQVAEEVARRRGGSTQK